MLCVGVFGLDVMEVCVPGAHHGQNRRWTPGAGVGMVVSCPLGTNTGSSVRAANALNLGAISSAPLTY